MKAAKSQFSNVPYTTGLMLRAPLRAPFSTNILLKYCTTCFIAAFEHKKKKQTASGLLLKSYMIWISPSVHLLEKKKKQKQTRRISSYKNAETFYVSNTHKEKIAIICISELHLISVTWNVWFYMNYTSCFNWQKSCIQLVDRWLLLYPYVTISHL